MAMSAAEKQKAYRARKKAAAAESGSNPRGGNAEAKAARQDMQDNPVHGPVQVNATYTRSTAGKSKSNKSAATDQYHPSIEAAVGAVSTLKGRSLSVIDQSGRQIRLTRSPSQASKPPEGGMAGFKPVSVSQVAGDQAKRLGEMRGAGPNPVRMQAEQTRAHQVVGELKEQAAAQHQEVNPIVSHPHVEAALLAAEGSKSYGEAKGKASKVLTRSGGRAAPGMQSLSPRVVDTSVKGERSTKPNPTIGSEPVGERGMSPDLKSKQRVLEGGEKAKRTGSKLTGVMRPSGPQTITPVFHGAHELVAHGLGMESGATPKQVGQEIGRRQTAEFSASRGSGKKVVDPDFGVRAGASLERQGNIDRTQRELRSAESRARRADFAVKTGRYPSRNEGGSGAKQYVPGVSPETQYERPQSNLDPERLSLLQAGPVSGSGRSGGEYQAPVNKGTSGEMLRSKIASKEETSHRAKGSKKEGLASEQPGVVKVAGPNASGTEAAGPPTVSQVRKVETDKYSNLDSVQTSAKKSRAMPVDPSKGRVRVGTSAEGEPVFASGGGSRPKPNPTVRTQGTGSATTQRKATPVEQITQQRAGSVMNDAYRGMSSQEYTKMESTATPAPKRYSQMSGGTTNLDRLPLSEAGQTQVSGAVARAEQRAKARARAGR